MYLLQMSSFALPDDDFESISSTNLTIMSTPSGLSSKNQSTHKTITKTISPSSTKLQLHVPQSKGGRERPNSGKRYERGSTHIQPIKEASVSNTSSSGKNELKHVFAKLQHRSVAQTLRQHLEEEEAEAAKPEKENKEKDVDGSTSNLKSECSYITFSLSACGYIAKLDEH